MDLSLNDTQQLIQDSARDFVRGACDRDVLLKLDRNPAAMMDGLWRQMSELGWTGMAIPEEYGGTGNSMTDVAVLFEELGTGPVPGPLFSSAVLCARILLEAASESTKKAWLPRIASGERVFALALTEAQYGWSADSIRLKASKGGQGFPANRHQGVRLRCAVRVRPSGGGTHRRRSGREPLSCRCESAGCRHSRTRWIPDRHVRSDLRQRPGERRRSDRRGRSRGMRWSAQCSR